MKQLALISVILCISAALPATLAAPSPSTGLAGAWAFNEGAGLQTGDASGNGNSGTLAGASWVPVAKRGGGISFDGSGASVQIVNSSSLDIGGTAITVSFWARIESSATTNMVVLAKPWAAGSQASPPYQYGVEFGIASLAADFYFGSGDGVPNGPFSIPLKPGTWTHVAFTYDGSFVRGYKDGAEVVSTAASGPIIARGNPLEIGAGSAQVNGLNGQLDDLRIYSRALTAEEIQSDMITGVGASADQAPPGTVLNLRRTDVH